MPSFILCLYYVQVRRFKFSWILCNGSDCGRGPIVLIICLKTIKKCLRNLPKSAIKIISRGSCPLSLSKITTTTFIHDYLLCLYVSSPLSYWLYVIYLKALHIMFLCLICLSSSWVHVIWFSFFFRVMGEDRKSQKIPIYMVKREGNRRGPIRFYVYAFMIERGKGRSSFQYGVYLSVRLAS